MTSTINVDNINTGGGATKFLDGKPSFDVFRLSANHTSNATITSWERPDETTAVTNANLNGLTASSGIFTFHTTGVYHVTACVQMENGTGADGTMGFGVETSVNGGTDFTLAAFCSVGDTDTGANTGTATQILFNVTDTSTHQMRFVASSLSSGSFVHGNTAYNLTSFVCNKIAPVQS